MDDFRVLLSGFPVPLVDGSQFIGVPTSNGSSDYRATCRVIIDADGNMKSYYNNKNTYIRTDRPVIFNFSYITKN